jgi:hypothetical protein
MFILAVKKFKVLKRELKHFYDVESLFNKARVYLIDTYLIFFYRAHLLASISCCNCSGYSCKSGNYFCNIFNN